MSGEKAVGAEAMHLTDGENHAVGLKQLRVLLAQDGDCWFAQGLEIDYAASGSSIEDVKTRFEDGLCATISAHIQFHGHIKKLLKVAPQDAWTEYFQATQSDHKQLFSTVHLCKAEKAVELGDEFPFDTLAFVAQQMQHRIAA